MVREYEVFNNLREVCLLGHLYTFSYMTDDDASALLQRHIFVWINARLVLSKEHWIGHLSYVVIQSTRTHQKTLCTNLIGYLGCQVAHGN